MRLLSRKGQDEGFQTSLHNEQTFYRAFSKDIKRANNFVVMKSPYITNRRASEFVDLLKKARSGLRVEVYTRNPYHHDGILIDEALRGIQVLKNAGVKVVTCDDMRHRKIAVIDGRILWEGSLNMLSQNGSREIMRRTNSEVWASQMLQFTGI